jgi:iron(III) transport system substrate-binding protein
MRGNRSFADPGSAKHAAYRLRRPRNFGPLLAMVVASVLLAACGAPPTQQPEGDNGAAASDGAGQAAGDAVLADVNSEVGGLEGDERRDKLVELAQEEGCELTFYTSTNVDESGPLTDAFTDAYDIDVSLYRAGSETIVQRVIEEGQANFPGADVVGTNGPEMTIMANEGMFAPLETPITEDIAEFAVTEHWAGYYLQIMVPVWNTDRVTGEAVPKTWEDVLTYDGNLALEVGDWDWFATLVKYFTDEQGMSEEEATDLFRQAADGASVVDGHTLMTELLAAGEYDMTASSYQNRVPSLVADGAPISWEPPVEPSMVRPNAIAIHRDTDCPATALLFVEWTLTDGQGLLAELDYTPANTTVEGAFPEDVETILVDVEALIQERDKWEALYEQIIRESGAQLIEE